MKTAPQNRKRTMQVIITGLYLTPQREAQVGQALMIELAKQLDGETDSVRIVFTPAEDDNS
jgi:hypothetical protein